MPWNGILDPMVAIMLPFSELPCGWSWAFSNDQCGPTVTNAIAPGKEPLSREQSSPSSNELTQPLLEALSWGMTLKHLTPTLNLPQGSEFRTALKAASPALEQLIWL